MIRIRQHGDGAWGVHSNIGGGRWVGGFRDVREAIRFWRDWRKRVREGKDLEVST